MSPFNLSVPVDSNEKHWVILIKGQSTEDRRLFPSVGKQTARLQSWSWFRTVPGFSYQLCCSGALFDYEKSLFWDFTDHTLLWEQT